MIFKCEKGVIQEHVYIDASQGSAPKEADCSGKVQHVMPIENGCNNYDWGSMYMAWEGFCEAPKGDGKDEKGDDKDSICGPLTKEVCSRCANVQVVG